MNREKLNQILCQHPKDKRRIYCECNSEFYITGHCCALCLKIFDLKIRLKTQALPKISRELFDQL